MFLDTDLDADTIYLYGLQVLNCIFLSPPVFVLFSRDHCSHSMFSFDKITLNVIWCRDTVSEIICTNNSIIYKSNNMSIPMQCWIEWFFNLIKGSVLFNWENHKRILNPKDILKDRIFNCTWMKSCVFFYTHADILNKRQNEIKNNTIRIVAYTNKIR